MMNDDDFWAGSINEYYALIDGAKNIEIKSNNLLIILNKIIKN